MPESPGASPGTVAPVTADPDSVDPGAEHRVERDTMGEVHVPAWALWGAQTQRAVENFPVSGVRLARRSSPPSPASGRLALANAELGSCPRTSWAIAEAAAEVAGAATTTTSRSMFQTGPARANMNANESSPAWLAAPEPAIAPQRRLAVVG